MTDKAFDTEAMDKLYLEWSQFTKARTAREITLMKALRLARSRIEYLGAACNDPRHFDANTNTVLPAIDEVLADVSGAVNPND